MINASIEFYKVGLNDKNLAFNNTALQNILSAGQILKNGQPYILRLSNLAFGQPLNVDEATFYIIQSATYLKINTTDENNNNAQVRYCFINNYLRLANGNWAISYTIDDWASFYLSVSSPYNIQIDGFTERANVPLVKNSKFNSYNVPLTAGTSESGLKYVYSNKPARPTGHGIALPSGYICAVYFISTPKYKGSPSGAFAHGTILDYNNANNTYRKIPRNNSNIYFMVFDNNGYNVGIYGKNSENDNYTEIVPAGNIRLYDPDDSSIDKIMYFDFIPSDDAARWTYGFQQLTFNGSTVWGIAVGGTSDNNLKIKLADIIHGNDGRYYMAEYLTNFAPIMEISLSQFSDLIIQNSNLTLENTYNNYIAKSLYKNIDEFREITIKCLSAEIKTSIANLYIDSKIIIEFSGDGETVIIKLARSDMDAKLRSNIVSATGQNTAYFDLVQVRDFKAYKNAKITGAAGIAATAVGSVTALGASIATGNVAGVVGALSGGAQGIISGVQKLQGLSPAQQSPANGDKTLTDIINDFDYCVYIIENIPMYELQTSRAKYLEENGAAVEMPFDIYMSNCQMQKFNAIKMSDITITAAPQQICRRIEEMFLSGVTLWTATDVGNKKVINYPIGIGA